MSGTWTPGGEWVGEGRTSPKGRNGAGRLGWTCRCLTRSWHAPLQFSAVKSVEVGMEGGGWKG